ncbi:MAG: hypothetical protein GC160_19790 [Acidobacteria bacterium]|nr:hypothetical protein [Acidobacteriota bacterium]
MIVLGPMDADLNGAPHYWRTANWRPYTREPAPANAFLPTVPFDKCDLVYEYDARFTKTPTPADQGWKLNGGSESDWKHDPQRGVLGFRIKEGASFWNREDKHETLAPERAAAYGLFLLVRDSGDAKQGGLDFVVEASRNEDRTRGMRANWTDRFLYRSLDDADSIAVVQPSAEPRLLQAWNRLALDAELVGADINLDGVEKDDGGKTIGSLDDLINNDDRRAFRYGKGSGRLTRATFGKTDRNGPLEGFLRNFCASYPGRFVRAGFRAAAPAERTRLRFVFCVDADRGFEPASAVFRVRYAAPSVGLRPQQIPTEEAPLAIRQFDAANVGRTVEVPVDVGKLEAGEELWFTLERDWSHEADKLRSTVHLLQVIVEEGSSRNAG